jgi:DNA-binding transcriptional MerR regulator
MSQAKRPGHITLQELAQQTGVSLSALNYYTNLGLLRVVDRQGNKRFYAERDALRRLEAIRNLRREGYPLRIIRDRLREGGS